MQITISEDAGAVAKVALSGKLDIAGAEVVAVPLAALAGSKTNIIIDMSGVSFLASIGIRHLVSTTKALSRRGGRLVLFGTNDMVKDVLVTSGVAELMQIVPTVQDAEALVR